MNMLPVLAATCLASCIVIPGPKATAQERSVLQRFERLANVAPEGESADERYVSALQAGRSPSASSDMQLVFLHGTPGDASGWSDYLLDPVAGLSSIAVDRPGFGESDPHSLATLEGQSRALEPFLDPARPTVLIGHSYGGPLALQAALDYPDRVVAAVILAGSVAPDLEKRRWYNYAAKGLSWVLPETLRRANQEVWPLRADLARLSKRLSEIQIPISVVHGSDDGLVPFGNALFMEKALVGARCFKLVRLEGAGHMFMWNSQWISHARAAIAATIETARAAQTDPKRFRQNAVR